MVWWIMDQAVASRKVGFPWIVDRMHVMWPFYQRARLEMASADVPNEEVGLFVGFSTRSLPLESADGIAGSCEWLESLVWPIDNHFMMAFMADFISYQCIGGESNYFTRWVGEFIFYRGFSEKCHFTSHM